MINKITTYDELMLEKERLQIQMRANKAQIHQDFREIKQELEPVKSIISFVSKLTSTGPGNFLMTGTANTVIDLVLKRFLLAKTGWVTRIVIPFLLKNYTSHFISEKKDSIIQKIASLFRKKENKMSANSANGNGKMHHVEEEE